ncbi:bifunctional metallophosphatase/5'-nucleotidase [Streptococcus sp. DD12]|uniref:bifunctional metallophosphatase/5'-nucleotidase n=1 Tax=Streptococcus sp. DD12 TaxID=1777880 RepID=UPI0008370249|nr:bifunctional metallophosphatase/5'-nucleotidase [Streptococcus sp. DD12]
MKESVRLLHLNDFHSHAENYPKLRRFFREHGQGFDGQVLRLDIGDNVDKSHPLTDATSGQWNVQLMNALGIDFATIGNNEGIGLSKQEMTSLYDAADFSVVLGNLRHPDGTRPTWAEPYAIFETSQGHRLAFLGYTFPYTLTYEPNGWQVLDMYACLEKDLALPQLTSADAVIVLSHLGLGVDQEMAKRFPQIDLIIGAHTHHLLEEGTQVNGVYLAAAGRYGEHVGEIDLVIGDDGLEDCVIKTFATSELPSRTEDKAWVSAMAADGHRLLAQVALEDFDRAPDLEESVALTMQAMRSATEADLCLLNTGIVVTPFAQNCTLDSLHQSLPHQMRLISLEVTSQELKDICQDIYYQAELLKHQAIRGMGFRGKIFGEMRSQGFTYKNGEIVYNRKVDKTKERHRLVLVDQYYFAPYFESLKQQKVHLHFPDLLRQTVARYMKGRHEKGYLT